MIDQGQTASTDARGPIEIRIGTSTDREQIYRLRYAVFAQELGQHQLNDSGRLVDALDAGQNSYLVAHRGLELLGFISLTRPGSPSLSIEKYVGRDAFPFQLDHSVLEVRLLTVPVEHRRTGVAALLMMGSFRVAQAVGAQRVVAMGRREVLAMYRLAGLTPLGIPVRIRAGRLRADDRNSGRACGASEEAPGPGATNPGGVNDGLGLTPW